VGNSQAKITKRLNNMQEIDYGLNFHHLGLAVQQPKSAITFLKGLNYNIGETVFDPLQNVHLLMCNHSVMPSVEIIYPAEGKGPLDRLLRSHKDGLVYHMCYTTQNLEFTLTAIEDTKDLRIFCVSPPKAAVLFNGNRVSFYMVADLGLIEIIEL
jgi:methylmalonyl-CoA/ethylmalonyl-CoA epimerase